MLEFKKIDFESAEILNRYYKNCMYESSEYSSGIKLFWNKFYHYEFAEFNNALITKYKYDGNTVFEMPVAGDGFDEDYEKLLDEIDLYCMDNEIIPMYSDIPESFLPLFTKRYNYLKIEKSREACDYLYDVDNLRYFKGRHYSGQRNHINKFKTLYPNYKFRELRPNENLDYFWKEFYDSFGELDEDGQKEKVVAMDMTAGFDKAGMLAGCIELDGKLIALSVSELRGNQIIIHIEKALTRYEGIYPLLVSEFLQHFNYTGCELVNREDDVSDRGLRISKLQYRPDKLAEKYVVIPHSELFYIDKIPQIRTERLFLSEITKEEAPEYARLCLDDERNKYWGYDYRKDVPDSLPGSDLTSYFYDVAKSDFESRMCLNLAIRLGDKFIGEAVIYNADYKGGAEIGCRIFSEYGGFGYGAEAFEALGRWAIFEAGFRYIVAKCYKENNASYKMLDSCMKLTGEDEQFYYFKRIV